MVGALANRNKAPKIVDRPAGLPMRVPLFPENYDWKEEYRVRKALREVFRDTSPEVWEELVRREGDKSYCVTAVSVMTEDPTNDSVGVICSVLAYDSLCHVFRKHLPNSPAKEGQPLGLDVGIGELKKWRRERKNKLVYQLQIELCRKAIEELAKVKRVSQKDKDQARRRIEAEIEKLARTKKPDLGEPNDFYLDFYRIIHGPKLAERIRKAVKKGSAENLSTISK